MQDQDLVLVNILSAIVILIVTFAPESPIRIALGVPFVLFFPGYTLVCALFPRNEDLDGVVRLALSIGLSLAMAPLIGLMLNYTPWGLRLTPTLASLFSFTLSMSMATAYRRRKLPSEEKFVPSFFMNIPKWRELSRLKKLMSTGMIVGIVAAGGLTAYFVSLPKTEESFTEFYVLGSQGKMENYPTNLTFGESGTVILSVVNYEHEEVNYTIVIQLNNETLRTIDFITLDHEMKWEEKITFTPEKTGDMMKLEFLLYREGVDEPYRRLCLWISVVPRE